MEPKKTKVQIATEFRELFNPEWRNIIYYGGRGSLKSHSVARALLLRARQTKLRILCTREIQKTIADSVHKLFKDLIHEYKLTEYQVTDKTIKNKLTGSEFLFAGLHRNVTEIKSMEGIDICWVEEAHSVTDESWDILTPTIRKPGSQIVATFNRMTELDPVYVRYVLNQPPRTYSRKVNYGIAENLGWMPDVLKLEMETDRANNPSLYAHKWLGEPVSQAERSIIGRESILNAMNREILPEGAIEIGVDVARMGGDKTVFKKRKGLKIIKTKVLAKKRTTEVCDHLEMFIDQDKRCLIKIDDTGVGGGVTDEMIKRGYNIMAINFGEKATDPDRYPNLISEAWFYLAQIIDQVELDYNTDLLMELASRQWLMDSKGRRAVESKDSYKKRGYRSPDHADATILCFYTPQRFVIEYAGLS